MCGQNRVIHLLRVLTPRGVCGTSVLRKTQIWDMRRAWPHSRVWRHAMGFPWPCLKHWSSPWVDVCQHIKMYFFSVIADCCGVYVNGKFIHCYDVCAHVLGIFLSLFLLTKTQSIFNLLYCGSRLGITSAWPLWKTTTAQTEQTENRRQKSTIIIKYYLIIMVDFWRRYFCLFLLCCGRFWFFFHQVGRFMEVVFLACCGRFWQQPDLHESWQSIFHVLSTPYD